MSLIVTAMPASPTSVCTASEPEATRQVVEGNNAFALDLYAHLKNTPGNLIYSPYSLSAALAMTYAGARGQTETQMAKVMHFPFEQDRFHPAFAALLKMRQAEGKKAYQLHVANALWGQKERTWLPAFLELTQKHYGAGLIEVDFKGDTERSRQRINTWVEEQTHDKIINLLQPGAIQPSTALVLTNAIYFKGDWKNQFDKARTRDAAFHVSGSATARVPMMFQEGTFRYAAHERLQVLDLPYVGDELSMIILLPKTADGLSRLEGELTVENINRWLTATEEHSLHVYLPRFKATSSFGLKEVLCALGMGDAFGTRADFSAMAESKDVLIDNVIHQAYIEVNEEGTEAAAATGITMRAVSLPPSFRADHPFVFFIRDNRSGSMLFIGRVMNPSIGG